MIIRLAIVQIPASCIIASLTPPGSLTLVRYRFPLTLALSLMERGLFVAIAGD